MRLRSLEAIAAALLLVSCSGVRVVPGVPDDAGARRAAQRYVAGNDIPPRFQWEANFGYCGEVSMISAGLYYGQYVSQYEARAFANPGIPQYKSSSQLLLDGTALAAAKGMHLDAVRFRTNGSDRFLSWVKQQVVAGHPVAIGIYNNEYKLYGKKNPHAGDAWYDHIVPVIAVTSAHPLSDATAYPDDTLEFSDNGLWGTAGHYPYLFTYTFGQFPRTRVQANAPDGPLYSLARNEPVFAFAVSGVTDPNHETLPVRVATSVNYERPQIVNGSNARPKPMPLVLTVTVSGLKPGVGYALYRYDDFSKVPDAAFNAKRKNAASAWRIRISSGSTYAFSQRIESDEIAVYRAVRADGP